MKFTTLFALAGSVLAVAMGEQTEVETDKAVMATEYLDQANVIINNLKAKAKTE